MGRLQPTIHRSDRNVAGNDPELEIGRGDAVVVKELFS